MARYTVRTSYVDVVGYIWMPRALASVRYTLDSRAVADLAEIDDGRIDRETVDQWVAMHAGDFSQVLDWRASIEYGDLTVDIPFETEDGESAYESTMEDDE